MTQVLYIPVAFLYLATMGYSPPPSLFPWSYGSSAVPAPVCPDTGSLPDCSVLLPKIALLAEFATFFTVSMLDQAARGCSIGSESFGECNGTAASGLAIGEPSVIYRVSDQLTPLHGNKLDGMMSLAHVTALLWLLPAAKCVQEIWGIGQWTMSIHRDEIPARLFVISKFRCNAVRVSCVGGV